MSTHRISFPLVRALVALAVAFVLLAPAGRVHAANVFTVTNTGSDGPGSLRQAVLAADTRSDPTPARIEFSIPMNDPGCGLHTPGVCTIIPGPGMPMITGGAITIDGGTQKTYQGDYNPYGPSVELYGGDWKPLAMIDIRSGANTIRGLALTGNNIAVMIEGPASWPNCCAYDTISDNYIGIAADDQSPSPNRAGIWIEGGTTYTTISNNLISGNSEGGIFITDSGTDHNVVQANRFGSVGGGWAPNGRYGVFITGGAQHNTVGGDSPSQGNDFEASGVHDIYILGAHQNTVANNTITGNWPSSGDAVSIEGDASANNVSANQIWLSKGHGLWIAGSGTSVAVNGNTIAGSNLHGVAIYDNAGPNSVTGNHIWNSGWSGLAIVNSDGNTVQDNEIGIDRTKPVESRGNAFCGVVVSYGSKNTIGPGNVIARNGLTTASHGVWIDGGMAWQNRITQNSIFANGGKGIHISNGGNTGLAAPTLTQANCQGFTGSGPAYSTIEIFSDAGDEGQYYEAWTPSTPLLGNIGWSGAFRGPHLTVTATDSIGNTSEFSTPAITGPCLKLRLPLIRR